MTERELWWALAAQIEPVVADDPDAEQQDLAWLWSRWEVDDDMFVFLLATSLGLSKREVIVNVRQHPHYPGRDLRCHEHWCEPPLWERCEHAVDGRCPYLYRPEGG